MNKIFILKIMRKPVLSFLFALLFYSGLSAQYESAIKSAIINLDFYEEEICATANRFKQNPREVMAVVFPEMIRYNLVKDFFETSALELIYANLGSREVDFSIGIFQMKPSFIEKLEDIIIQNPAVFSEYLFVAKYDVSDE
ncbi:MAG TPA: hypothetical protein PKC40_11755, partial [Saprospiraceae bacterium]|nr:hypothetical protein [Saprospiraceae bacterium]